MLEGTKIGDSISIDGVCQTVTEISKDFFCAQISPQTISATTLSTLKQGSAVNLERALTLQQRLGGHIVTGHVDSCAKVEKIQKYSDFYTISFKPEKEILKYIAQKGSVTINGISLTVSKTLPESFECAIIPHTFENTGLNMLKTGSYVNIETDILAKYVEKILSTNNNISKATIDEQFLKENGFF